jgi:micrococcal nuclease
VSNAEPSTTNAPTKKPGATSKPTAEPKASTRPASTKLPVTVSSRTASVPRNGTASVSIKTSAKARCSIEVDYNSGPSTAAGLNEKTAGSTGVVSWSWKVGSNTTRGTWPIYVTCGLGSRSGSAKTSFTVR